MTKPKNDDAIQKVMNELDQHVQIMKQNLQYDKDTVQEAVERWKNQ